MFVCQGIFFFEVLLVCPCFVLEEWFCVHLAVVGRSGHCFSERELLVLLDVALGPGGTLLSLVKP